MNHSNRHVFGALSGCSMSPNFVRSSKPVWAKRICGLVASSSSDRPSV